MAFLVECSTEWGLPSVGIEASDEALTLARRRCPDLPLVKHYPGEPLPFADASHQTVVMNQVIEHLESDRAPQLLSECSRILKPGGMLLITSPNKYNVQELLVDPTHCCMYAPSELRAVLYDRGFTRTRAFDQPRSLLGRGRMARRVMRVLFTLVRWDMLSATANCITFRPDVIEALECEQSDAIASGAPAVCPAGAQGRGGVGACQ